MQGRQNGVKHISDDDTPNKFDTVFKRALNDRQRTASDKNTSEDRKSISPDKNTSEDRKSISSDKKVSDDNENTAQAGSMSASMMAMNLFGVGVVTDFSTAVVEDTGVNSALNGRLSGIMPEAANPQKAANTENPADMLKQGEAEANVADFPTVSEAKNEAGKGASIKELLINSTDDNETPELPDTLNAAKLNTNEFEIMAEEAVQNDAGNSRYEKLQNNKTEGNPGIEQMFNQDLTAKTHQQTTGTAPHAVSTEGNVPKAIQLNEHVFSVNKLSDTSIEVRLEPDGLGSVKIQLNIEKGTLHADIRASDEAAKVIIEKNLNDIVKALTQEGLTVGDFSVSLKDKGSQDGNGKQQGNDGKKGLDGDSQEAEITSVNRYSTSDDGLINIFA